MRSLGLLLRALECRLDRLDLFLGDLRLKRLVDSPLHGTSYGTSYGTGRCASEPARYGTSDGTADRVIASALQDGRSAFLVDDDLRLFLLTGSGFLLASSR